MPAGTFFRISGPCKYRNSPKGSKNGFHLAEEPSIVAMISWRSWSVTVQYRSVRTPGWAGSEEHRLSQAMEAAIAGAAERVTTHAPRLADACAAMGVARFFFHDLCEQPLAASDYLRIAREFHTLIIDRIPVMDFDERNAAKRFIILIDTLYDNAVKLVAYAAAEPTALYLATEGYEANEFKRTASRLIEMRSDEYLARPHGHNVRGGSGSTAGIVET